MVHEMVTDHGSWSGMKAVGPTKQVSGEIVEPKRFVFAGYRRSALSHHNSNSVRLTVRHIENPVGIDEHAVRSREPA